jgi:hypothetical protein
MLPNIDLSGDQRLLLGLAIAGIALFWDTPQFQALTGKIKDWLGSLFSPKPTPTPVPLPVPVPVPSEPNTIPDPQVELVEAEIRDTMDAHEFITILMNWFVKIDDEKGVLAAAGLGQHIYNLHVKHLNEKQTSARAEKKAMEQRAVQDL